MSESQKCFQFISENVPQWIADLEALETKIKDRHHHISRVPVPARKLKKTGSNESIRPASGSGNGALEVMSAPQDDELANPMDNHQLYCNRKRKTASVLTTDSIPTKYRTRSMIIVYYDSDIQKGFEQVVRHIGTARNHIRKARTAYRMENLANDNSVTFGFGSRTGMASVSGYGAAALLRSARGPPPKPGFGVDSDSRPTDAFAAADAALEKSQSLCERGAHQFLREGDCEAEVIGAKDSFEECKRLSDEELRRLKDEEEKREQKKIDEEKENPEQKKEQEETDPEAVNRNHNIFLCGGPIEVDDNAGSIDDLDDPLLQMPAFRSSRLMARS